MPVNLDRIRSKMNIEPTSRDKGLTLTVKVTAYDNGMVQVDGVPINAGPEYDQGEGWLVAAEVVVATMAELRRQAVRRQADRRG